MRTTELGAEKLTISRLAQLGGVNLETIRYYERQGLLPEPPRTAAGYRVFPREAARRLRFMAFRERPAAITSLGELTQGFLHGLKSPDFLVDVRNLCFSPCPHVSPFRAGLYP